LTLVPSIFYKVEKSGKRFPVHTKISRLVFQEVFMSRRRVLYLAISLCSLALWAIPAFAQFTANIQGIVQDPTGAGVVKARIELRNLATAERKAAASDASGNYRFVSLAPGN
jgi:hypothetical protein